jgi:hypothetical protein
MRDEVPTTPSKSFEPQRNDYMELAAASKRFATVLRTRPVQAETTLRDSRNALCCGEQRPLWMTALESNWHRYIANPIKAATIH